jgi:hypothetical protein
MRRVFADAWFCIALLDPHDAGHAAARMICADGSVAGFITTRWVLMEVANMLAGTKARRQCTAVLQELSAAPDTRVIPDSEELFQRALVLYGDRTDKAWSLTDCVSFLVMSDEGLTEALTGDHHFEQAGFKAVFAG